MAMLKPPKSWGFRDPPIPVFMKVPGAKWRRHLCREERLFSKVGKSILIVNGIRATVVAVGLIIPKRGRRLINVPFAVQRILSNISIIRKILWMRIGVFVQTAEAKLAISLEHHVKMKFVPPVIVRWFEGGHLLFRDQETIIAINEITELWKLLSLQQEIARRQN